MPQIMIHQLYQLSTFLNFCSGSLAFEQEIGLPTS